MSSEKFWYMSKWYPSLKNVAQVSFCIELSEDEVEKLVKAIAKVSNLNPCSFFSDIDAVSFNREKMLKMFEKFELLSILEKIRALLNELKARYSCRFYTIRFDHASPKDVAYCIWDGSIDFIGFETRVHPLGQSVAFTDPEPMLMTLLLSERCFALSEKDINAFSKIWLRPFNPRFDPEYRVFVLNGEVKAITQYYIEISHSVKIGLSKDKNLCSILVDVFEVFNKVKEVVKSDTYVFDVGSITQVDEKSIIYTRGLIDINPCCKDLYLGLFTEEELEKIKNMDKIVLKYLTTNINSIEIDKATVDTLIKDKYKVLISCELKPSKQR